MLEPRFDEPTIDYLTNNIMLPIGGLAIVVVAGWAPSATSSAAELDPDAAPACRARQFGARFIASAAARVLSNPRRVF